MSAIQSQSLTLVDKDGKPFPKSALAPRKKEAYGSVYPQLTYGFSNYLASLYGLDSTALLRSMTPFETHAWVYAGAMAIAMNVGQAPFVIFQETEDTQEKRKQAVLRAKRSWMGAPAGDGRAAIKRHLCQQSRRNGVKMKGLEADFQHPLMRVLAKPNELMTESQLWQATILWQVLKGSCFWLLLGDNDQPLGIGDIPTQIIPLPPDYLYPIVLKNKLAFWRYTVPRGLGQGVMGRQIYLKPNEVVQFRFFNQNDFIGGYAPISSSASAIHLDTLAAEETKSLLINKSDPGGVLTTDSSFENKAEEQEVIRKWEQRHKGSYNKGRTAILTGGMQYVSTGLSPQDMQWKDMRTWNREEILAVMGVPKSIVCVTDDMNFSIQIAQDRNFWDKTLIPRIRNIEDMIDGTLLYNEPDTTVAAFDLSGIEALKAGLAAQVDVFNVLTGPNIHMPPATAKEVIGLDIPQYAGDDVAIASPMLRAVPDIISDSPDANPFATDTTSSKTPGKTDSEDNPSGSKKPKTDPATSDQPGNSGPSSKSAKQDYWQKYITELHGPSENLLKKSWRLAMLQAKEQNLNKFDSYMAGKAVNNRSVIKDTSGTPIGSIIIDSQELKNLIADLSRNATAEVLAKTFDYTVKELNGVATFEIDDPLIIDALNKQHSFLAAKTSASIQNALTQSLSAGISAGEGLETLRKRVSEVYDFQASPSKTLAVARTAATGVIGSARSAMFQKQGIETSDWITAGDELVRESHDEFGSVGPQPIGFNYLTLIGEEGELKYPGDLLAPADQVIHCRCVQIPAS